MGPDWCDSQLTVYFLFIINTHYARWAFDVSHLRNGYLFIAYSYLTAFSHLWGVCAAQLNIFSVPLALISQGCLSLRVPALPSFFFVCWIAHAEYQGQFFTEHGHLLMQRRGVFSAPGFAALPGQVRDPAFSAGHRNQRTHRQVQRKQM